MEHRVFDNEKFISLVEPNACLWDTAHTDYCDRNRKQQCWVEISEEMCDYFEEMTAEQQNEYVKELQKKWKNLRNSFARELARRRKKKSGENASWKTYVFFEQLSFLIRCPTNKETTSNFSDENTEIADAPDSEENEGAANITARPVHKKKKLHSKIEDDSQIAGLLEKSIERQKNEILSDNDADRHFLLSLLPDFKRVPEDRRIDLKMAILQSIKLAQSSSQSIFDYNHIQPLP